VVAAALSVLVLKVMGLASGEGWALRLDQSSAVAHVDNAYRPVAWAHEALTIGTAHAGEHRGSVMEPLITGSTPPKKDEPAAATPPAGEGATPVPDAIAPPANALQNSDSGQRTTPGERAVLERLTERRAEIEDKAKEIEMRDSLLQAAEKRIEARIKELEAIEARIAASKPAEGADAEGTQGELPPAKLKDLVTMYENMKPKDAAKIFDELNMRVLVDVVKQMNPRKMSEVLAKMSPTAAQRLTVELAGGGRRQVVPVTAVQALPQIQGIPAQP
jgi:flagellar motility protein MotE (MotC chaperone)